MYGHVQLKAGREAATGFHHPWIFSGAIENVALRITHGDLVHVTDRNGRIIGTGTYSAHGTIRVRLLAYEAVEITQAWITATLQAAQAHRALLGYGPGTDTTGYRVVFSEADNLPGLVIDRYGSVLVLQLSTAGMEQLRPLILAACQELFSPSAVYERSDMSARNEEYLPPVTAIHYGVLAEPVPFQEHGQSFVADVLGGQKTGFFLDQKDLRQQVRAFARDKKVLNLFAYTGATSVVALLGGGSHVHNVDQSAPALELIPRQLELNNLAADKSTSDVADVFQWLNDHATEQYDMVIVDPPALTKKKSDLPAAQKAYHFLNRAAMRLVAPGGLLVTSSCSHFFTSDDLAFVLRRASVQAGVQLRVLKHVTQSADHPLSVYFPESAYLKSYICQVGK